MATHGSHRNALLAGALCLVVTAGILGQQRRPGPPAHLEAFGSTVVTWSPTVEYERGVLVVTGEAIGELILEFGPDEPLQLDVGVLPDGEYAYELLLFRIQTPEEWAAEGRPHVTGLEVEAEVHRRIGHVTVRGGMILQEEETTSSPPGGLVPRPRDQCFLDDVIVDGSLCVGFDCVCNESFGFDTIRLKENNLRIKFQDTSNSASFPTNDWQITINDSSNGGAEKFSIDDISGGRTPFTIEAGAPSHSLFVDDGGRLGLGTSTPVVDVHVKSGNTPTLRLEQDGSSGFTPQTWDVAGNEANFFIRDATNGSTLPFRIRPGAPSSSIDIAAGGDVRMLKQVGIGYTSSGSLSDPFSPLNVKGSGLFGEQITLMNDGDTSKVAMFGVGGSADLFIQTTEFNVGSVSDIILQAGFPDGSSPGGNVGIGTTAPSEKLHVVGNICATGTIGACSDGRFKKNVKKVNDALVTVSRLRGVEFDWKRDEYPDRGFSEKRQVGFVAQEIEDVVPGAVSRGSDGYYSVDYGRVTPVLVEAIKELNAKITIKDAAIARDHDRIAELQAENVAFRARLERLEALIGATADADKSSDR